MCCVSDAVSSDLVWIVFVGKYVKFEDVYLFVVEVLRHAGFYYGCLIDIDWVDFEMFDDGEVC